jgi:membrane-bound acyltransferase YfiQ involved in biofilm formation
MYALFYLSLGKYPNKFAESLTSIGSRYLYITIYITLHASSIYLFLTAAKNPGYVSEVDTVKSKQDKTKLFVRYDEFNEVHSLDNSN